jgi:CBS domain-containing protein
MIISELMQHDVRTCTAGVSLAVPARIMWEHDCGSVPVMGEDGQLTGMITDRDICMAAYLRGQPLHECTVADVMSRPAIATHANDTLAKAEDTMRDNRIRRLPVVDESGRLTASCR